MGRKEKPIGVTVLSLAHFGFGLTPLLWLTSVLVSPSLNGAGGGEPVADATIGAFFALLAIVGLIANGIVCLGLGYGLWRCNNGARLLVMMFGALWVLAGVYFIYSVPILTFRQPLSFLRLIAITYGFAVIYYLTRNNIKASFT